MSNCGFHYRPLLLYLFHSRLVLLTCQVHKPRVLLLVLFYQVVSESDNHQIVEDVFETIIQDVINCMADEEERYDGITL